MKTTVAFGIDFACVLLLLFITGFFKASISVYGLSGKIGFHGRLRLSLYS